MTPPSTFGELVRAQRQKLGLGLREFCVASGMDPAYLSRIERGVLAPPQDPERLAELAEHLGIASSGVAWKQFTDLAAVCAGNVPQDILDDEQMVKKLPALFRTVRGQRLTEEKLRQLIDFLRDK